MDEATLQKPLHLIESQAMRCADLVRALLEYVRRKPVTREPCEVRLALERVLTIAGLQASKRQVRLEAHEDAVGDDRVRQRVCARPIARRRGTPPRRRGTVPVY